MPNKTLLIRNAESLVTMDAQRREIRQGGLFVENNRIVAVGPSETLPHSADEVIDLRGHIVIPGLINTHHHMYQSLTRAVPAAQNGELFNWLSNLYPIWARLTPEMIGVSTLTAMAELILSGCTTSSDHLYIYPNGCRLDHSIEAAAQIGMRFHASRGSMSVGQSKGGLPPDAVVEDEAAILRDTQRLIETYHDADRYAMQRVVVAPCSPFSVSRDLMREAAALARHYGVSLHTHLAENVNDIAYSREKFGMTPAEYAQDLGWVGHDVWHAHCVQLDAQGIELFARTGTGVAHCPCSNMRLASGIAPIRKMRDAGVPVGLGVDGSASNDAGHMMSEVRQALLLQRVGFG
ncbi:MAG: 8-oxoguanine deaminase, partial [Burkholderiales bacterium]|nr:8-oxoguanine deaminase [Burkholderiales bacterium]